ncbi:MAG: cell division protein SepF [Clostridia bacterium]|nr:cell division protein SepF [Clostridia bacterium]
MSFLSKFNDLVFGPEDDEEVEFATNSEPQFDFDQPPVPPASSKKPKVVNIAATTQLKVVVVSIEQFDEAREVADHLRSKKPVVINLEKLEKDVARRVIDFISGAVYALGGSIQKVSGGIFLIAPYNVDIMSDVRDELKNTGIFPWEE